MGQLVFQATLGGQVNLVGPNTASTFNINVPATSGNMVTTGDTGTVTATMLASTTGSGAVVLATSPTLVTPALGTPSALVGTNITGTAAGLSIGGNAATATTATNVSGGTSSVTSETVSGNLTLSGGTANGVAYLNGSKVVTTGSALTFDGTDFTAPRTQITTAGSPPASGAGLELVGGTGPIILAYNRGTSAYISLNYTASAMQWNIGASAAMSLDTSGNLGIGTSSPGAKLNVVGADAAIVGLISGATNGIRFIPKASSAEVSATDKTGSSSYQQLDLNGSLLTFLTSGAERMRIDTSGNLGLGVTPSAWGTNFRALQLPNGSALWNPYSGTGTALGANVYQDATNEKYIATDSYATQYKQVNGQHQWKTAGSGTAGNAITFTQAMTLDASGNLLVGVTSYNAAVNSNYLLYGSGLVSVGHVSGTSSGTAFQQFVYNATQIGSITQSGTTAVLYNVTSDQRLKTNIADAAPASALIDAIQVRQYDWKSDGSHQRYGFIAQELVTVAPEAVHQPADPEEMMAVDYSKLVPMLVKEIQDLRKRLAAAGIA